MLTVICEELLEDNYSELMIGSLVDQSTFEFLFQTHLPKIFNHIKSYSVPIDLITQAWFICFFIGYLPYEVLFLSLLLSFFWFFSVFGFSQHLIPKKKISSNLLIWILFLVASNRYHWRSWICFFFCEEKCCLPRHWQYSSVLKVKY